MTDERGKVIPFRRHGTPAPARPATNPARQLAAQQTADWRGKHLAAQARDQNQRLIAAGQVIPARITIALDMQGLEGPEVDAACDATEPDVDLWECGVTAPSARQVELLAALTGFPVAWFYQPIEPGTRPVAGPVWMCGPSGCESKPPDYVDERGVLHYGGEPPRTPPADWQGALF